jgi:hypothetical protein
MGRPGGINSARLLFHFLIKKKVTFQDSAAAGCAVRNKKEASGSGEEEVPEELRKNKVPVLTFSNLKRIINVPFYTSLLVTTSWQSFKGHTWLAGLLQDREEAGLQGAASPLTEREVPSPPPISLPPKAAKKDFATPLTG